MLWSMRTLQYADSLLDGTLMDRTMLVAGSSGGLIGASYYRQLSYLDGSGETADRATDQILHEISSDLLNPIAFSFATNDMFFRYRKVKVGEHSYTLDRAFAFEEGLHRATHGVLDIRLGEMAVAEREARTPLLVISPTSINDGRRLVISSQPMSFLTSVAPEGEVASTGYAEAIEFRRMFSGQGADSIKLSSALRMNATFPYITPVVSLPSEPTMRVMDAGMRDNYGYRVTLSFLHTFRDWIAENTNGVVILQLRDSQREIDVKPSSTSLLGRILDPIGSVYDNFIRIQDQDLDLMMRQATAWAHFPLNVIDLELRHSREEQISLSWHLTELERQRVLRSVGSGSNQRAFERLKELVIGHDVPAALTAETHGGSVHAMDPSLP